MNKNKYRISAKAVEDLNRIWLYTYDNWSMELADRYYNLVVDEIDFLAVNKLSGKSIDHIRKGYRVSIVKSHLIFYRIPANGIIEVIRILHQRMDVEGLFKE
jgi:toxin ParE1/3/4